MNRRWPLPQEAHGLAGERGIYNNYSNVIAAIMRLVDGTGGDTGQEALNWGGVVGKEGQQALHSTGTNSADRQGPRH